MIAEVSAAAGEAGRCDAGPARPGEPRLKRLGRVEYASTYDAMREFTATRSADTADEIWLLEHPPVYTLGQAGRREHLLRENAIPVVAVDRGGQVTYHGPGQVVAYLLFDLRRAGLTVRELVRRMEQAVIDVLAAHGVAGERRCGAPGVYVGGAKIAALGLRVRQGCTYHGLALNVDMDLAPFTDINPCGYAGLAVTQLRDLGVRIGMDAAGDALAAALIRLVAQPYTRA